MENISSQELALIVPSLPQETKYLGALELVLKVGPDFGGAWYSSQKEHWMGWLGDYCFTGAYERKHPGNHPAQTVYNRIGCSPMLFWLGEAASIPETQIRQAFDAVIGIRTSRMASHCRAIRQIIPWEDIARSLAQLPVVSHDVQEMHSREILTARDRLRAKVYKREV